MAWLLVFLSLLAPSAEAQTRKNRPAPAKPAQRVETADRWPVETLKVEGNRNYTDGQVLTVAGLKIGQMAGKTEFEAARERLLATGMFESVGYRFEPAPGGKGYAASFQIVEVEPVYPVRIEALPAPAEGIERALKQSDPLFSSRIPATKPVLDRYVRVIEDFLTKSGKPEKVIGRVMADGPDQLFVIFRSANLPPAVAEVRFTGNSVIPTTTLQTAIHGVAIGTLFNDARFRQILDAGIRPLYESRGRIRVKFPSIETERAKDVNGLVVKVAVEEGESYELGDVNIEGPGDSKSLFKMAKFRTGEIANFDEIKAGVGRIEQAMRRNGYMKVKSTVARRIDDAKKKVDLDVKLDPGPQFLFGRLAIQGLDIVSEPEIRKMWALKEGKPFNVEYPEFFLGRVREEGMFDNLGKTSSTVKVNDATRTVDVTLVFEGSGRPPEQRKRRAMPGF